MGNLNNQKNDPDNTIINEEKLKDINPINLIEKVKSKYITNIIFSYLERILKLKIIKYNKKCQNLFGINIENYKEKKIKRIMKKNGFGKEYTLDGNKLVFEGEFKNDKKNGKGKEYYETNGKIFFYGTYLNGKRHGIGKEYHLNGKIKFEGEYSNGYKIEGKGYSQEGKLELIFGRDGEGREYYPNEGKLSFKGTYLDGKRHGKGIEYYSSGEIKFEGEYSNGYKIEGKGYNYFGKIIFELERNGKGKEYDIIGKLKYEGEFLNGKRNGKGKEYNLVNGKLKYEGEYKEDLLHGKVKKYDNNGNIIFEGEYKEGKKWNGISNEEYEYTDDGPFEGCFQGEYLNGKRWNGKGEEHGNYHLNRCRLGNIILFKGEYIKGKRKGIGERYNNLTRKKYSIIIDEVNGKDNNI